MLAGLLLAATVAVAVAQPTPIGALATTPFFRKLGVADGLPSSKVYKVVQDRDGLIWIATEDGLARYDGTDIRVYRHDPGDPASLSGNDVSALLVDRDGRIWCGGEGAGLNLLEPGTAKFEHFRHDPGDAASLTADDVWAIAQDRDGAIWVGTYSGGLDRVGPRARAFDHFRASNDADGPRSNNVLSLLGAGGGQLWIGTDIGLDMRATDGRFAHVDFGAVGGDVQVTALAADADDAVLVGTRGGLLHVDPALRVRAMGAAPGVKPGVYGIARDPPDGLWLATRNGLAHRRVDGHIDVWTANSLLSGSLPGKYLLDAFADREGGLWLATHDGGVAYLSPLWRNFSQFRRDPENAHTLSANAVAGLATDARAGVWAVNNNGGIDRLDLGSGAVERWGERLAVPDTNLWSVLPDRNGRLWVGHPHGIRVYELTDQGFHDLPVDPGRADALASGTVAALVQAPDDTIWAAVRGGGAYRIDARTLAVKRYIADAAGGLQSTDLVTLALDPGGVPWLLSAVGADCYDAGRDRFAPVAGAPNERIDALAFAADGSVWLHRLGALEHYQRRVDGLRLIERLDARDGWPAVRAGGLVIARDHSVWATTPRGLLHANPATHAIRRYDGGDGLSGSEFSESAPVVLPDGRVVAGTLTGLVAFDPERIVENSIAPQVVVVGASVRRGGDEVALAPGAASSALHWNDRDLRFSARAMSFVNPAGNRFQWQLQGFDAAWVDTGSRGEREFSQLPPGRYRLRVRAANAAGVWGEPTAPRAIHVATPPWATRWALAGYALLGSAAMLLALRAYRVRVDRRHRLALNEQQRHLAEQASAAKTSFLATMGHEIRTPMTGVLGMAELLLRTPLDARQRDYAQAIDDSGQMMLRLVNDALDLARIEAGKLTLERVPLHLHRVVREVAALAQPLAQRKGLSCNVAIAADAPRHVLGDAVRIKQILLNLANNAIKFTEHGGIDLILARVADGQTLFTVRDTGPGIPGHLRERLFQRFEQAADGQRHGGSGLGLAICRELVARMDGTIGVDSEPGSGATFRVTLRLQELADATPTTVARASAAPEPAPPRRCVLVVEDNAIVAAVVVELLQAHGHRVVHAAHGLAALAELEMARFDLALIDLDLPGLDGFGLARMIRQREVQLRCARLPLVAITARSGGDEEARSRAAGMDLFLRKPLSGAALAAAIARCGSAEAPC